MRFLDIIQYRSLIKVYMIISSPRMKVTWERRRRRRKREERKRNVGPLSMIWVPLVDN
jgi:hypothetical protein